ncbi:hypothetical protein BHE74_00008516 [Ensete ventricosum]|nr:hypothetical protein BHE74_00008516 [Ensete ventricosum]RZR85794.1 hypothetical protein BHM03_00012833 [Ensete ventricosum]
MGEAAVLFIVSTIEEIEHRLLCFDGYKAAIEEAAVAATLVENAAKDRGQLARPAMSTVGRLQQSAARKGNGCEEQAVAKAEREERKCRSPRNEEKMSRLAEEFREIFYRLIERRVSLIALIPC